MNHPIHVTAALLITAISASAQNPASAKKPNILVIVADDLGYGESGAQGYTKDIPTPHLDELAAGGTRFTSGYVTGVYCSPTRAALLTGRYQQRFGHEFNPGPAPQEGQSVGLSLKEKTIGDYLKAAGYATGWFGKSHLGSEPQFHPQKRGFDEFFGFLGGAHSYTNPGGESRNAILRGTEPVKDLDYTTEAFAREAADFIARHRQKPWFVYLPFNAVHAPLETLEKYESRFTAIPDQKRRKFAALLSALDDGVGTVLGKVRELGQEEQTLVFFFSDNGGPTPSITSGNGPLRGYKGQTLEGGIRVPFFVQWKGTLPAGKVDDRPVIQLDVLPTALAAAGIPVEADRKLDGVNLLPYLKDGNAAQPHDSLFWRFGEQFAIRSGEWKLVKAQQGPGSGTATTSGAELYHLAADIGETKNLAAEKPDKVKELAAQWEAWNAQLVPPSWRPGQAAGRAGAARRIETSNASATGPWKSGDVVAGTEAPRVAGLPLSISAEVDTDAADGVIIAQGARRHGYAFYLDKGTPTLAIRADGELTTAAAGEKLTPGKHTLAVTLSAEGRAVFIVDGKPAGEGKVSGPLPKQPGEGLTVGSDGQGAVGDYAAPAKLNGSVANVSLSLK